MRIGGVRREGMRWNSWLIAITIIICGGCVSLPVMHFHEIYANSFQFNEDTYLARLLAEAMGSTRFLPEDYTVKDVRHVIDRFKEETGNRLDAVEAGKEFPNIIVIMNEAFSDLRVLGGWRLLSRCFLIGIPFGITASVDGLMCRYLEEQRPTLSMNF